MRAEGSEKRERERVDVFANSQLPVATNYIIWLGEAGNNYNISDTGPHAHSVQVAVAFLKFGSCRVGEAWDLKFGR